MYYFNSFLNHIVFKISLLVSFIKYNFIFADQDTVGPEWMFSDDSM